MLQIPHKQSSWIQTKQTRGQPYSDTSPNEVIESSLVYTICPFQMTWWESWWRLKEKWRRNFQGLNHPKKKSFHSQKTWSSALSCRSAERSWKCRPRRQLTLPLQNKMIVGAIYHIKIYNLPSCMTGLTKSFTTTYMPTEFHRPMSTVLYSKYLYK